MNCKYCVPLFLFVCVFVVRNSNCFRHGTKQINENSGGGGGGGGGTCAEFKKLNNLTSSCCPDGRDDECYMTHYDTRCYCDTFCNRVNDNSDCCPDASQVCTDSTADGVATLSEEECDESKVYMENCNK